MPANPREDLRPRLEQARKTLDDALSRACSADIYTADTSELIRIEEVLAIANEAAKEAISVRRRLANEGPSAAAAFAPVDDSPNDGAAPRAPDGHREIEDSRGVRWMAFAVHPQRPASGRAALHDRLQDGWLAFDCGLETRRLTPIPAGWASLSDHDLCQLCEVAEPAPRRVKDRPPTA